MRTGTFLVALGAFLAGGCGGTSGSAGRTTEGMHSERLRRRAGRLLQEGIAAFNNGRIARARKRMEFVLRETKDSPLAALRAEAHFYLAAVAWDLGDRDGTAFHLGHCRRIDPEYKPEWKFISPSLRRRFEALGE